MTVVPNIIKPHLKILFCGINPGLYSAKTGHHFAHPSNRFWTTLHLAGFTSEQLSPDRQSKLLDYGYGITNLVSRSSVSEAELSKAELVEGQQQLVQIVKEFQPSWLAVVGVGAYRKAFDQPKAQIGLQSTTVNKTRIWVLPNPSGLNASYPQVRLTEAFRALLIAIESLTEDFD